MGSATQNVGGPLINGNIPPGMSYSTSTGGWTFTGPVTTSSGMTVKTSVVTDTVTLDGTYHCVVCNKGTAMTVNLPAVASNAGREYMITNKGAGVVTVDGNASEAIGNAATATLNQWQSIHIVCDGAQWVVVG